MLKYKNLTVVGTSHISIYSIKEVKSTINALKHKIIALELDKSRFLALTTDKRQNLSPVKLGFKAFLINKIGFWIETKLGKMVGASPGQEIKEAIKIAKENNIQIALIDQDIKKTLNKIINNMPKKEKLNFIFDLIKAFFSKSKVTINLKKVPPKKLVNELLNDFKIRYPKLYETLVQERNIIMAKNLYTLMSNNQQEQIVAILGIGHEEEVIKEIKKFEK